MAITNRKIKPKPRPPVKWAGGKGQLLAQLEPLFPEGFQNYHEPFVGGGAVFFYLLPKKASLIDNNKELINFYLVVRDNLEALLQDLPRHINEKSYYYKVRALNPEEMDPVKRASRFLFLNKTSFNGLWRVNRKGEFNVPFGYYKKPRIIDEPNLRLVSSTLQDTEITLGDFALVLEKAQRGDFIYFDPPYHPLSETSSFTSYTAKDFGEEDQKRLADVFRTLDQRGCLVMLSNSDTPFIRELYDSYNISIVKARRAINCRSNKRGPVNELVVRNFS